MRRRPTHAPLSRANANNIKFLFFNLRMHYIRGTPSNSTASRNVKRIQDHLKCNANFQECQTKQMCFCSVFGAGLYTQTSDWMDGHLSAVTETVLRCFSRSPAWFRLETNWTQAKKPKRSEWKTKTKRTKQKKHTHTRTIKCIHHQHTHYTNIRKSKRK